MTTSPVDALLSVMTVPLLVGLLGAKAMAEMMEGAGAASEEVFRGDRLPLLNNLASSNSSSNTAS
ncbi:MAG: hypothetical protein VKJ64_19600 [Leptolyngbyaceae bacterium]|nr:hypothetical protein [Leptolyngbyaceae bacterium]